MKLLVAHIFLIINIINLLFSSIHYFFTYSILFIIFDFIIFYYFLFYLFIIFLIIIIFIIIKIVLL